MIFHHARIRALNLLNQVILVGKCSEMGLYQKALLEPI